MYCSGLCKICGKCRIGEIKSESPVNSANYEVVKTIFGKEKVRKINESRTVGIEHIKK